MADKTLAFDFDPGADGFTAFVYPRTEGEAYNSDAIEFEESTEIPGRQLGILSDLASGNGLTVVIYQNDVWFTTAAVDLLETEGTYLIVDRPTAGEIAAGIQTGGPDSLVVTVTDTSDVPLPNIGVSIKSGSILVFAGTTDADGQVIAGVPSSGTFSVTAAGAGYNADTVTVDTSSQEEVTIPLSAFTPLVSGTGLVTGYLTCYDVNGNPVSGKSHVLSVVSLPRDAVGISVETADRTVVSGSGSNNVQFADLVPGGVYEISRDGGIARRFEAQEQDFPIPVSGGPA